MAHGNLTLRTASAYNHAMLLSDYQWSRNPRGMHGTGNNHVLWENWKLGWVKTTFEDNSGIEWGGYALNKGMTPITRIFRRELSGRPMDDNLRSQYKAHIDVGIKWFEFYNEPNLPYEWYDGVELSPNNMDLIRPLCENWLPWAEFIINNGGYPGFIALSETTSEWGETTAWLTSLLQYMFDHHYNRFRNIIDSGMWIPTHPYILNHWYQERPGGGPLSARGPNEVNWAEGGWHFEYPYDPISQADDPGRTVWGGTPKQPQNDVFGVLGSGIAWLEKLQEMFGVGWIPVVGTEGGIWHIPSATDPVRQQDDRYPPYNMNSFSHGTVAMFNWIAQQAPKWMFGITLWRIEDYWRYGDPIPALNYLANSPAPQMSGIPSIPALGDAPSPYDPNFRPAEVAQQPTDTPEPTAPPPTPELTLVPPGPGPVHGAPEHHFVMLAPGLNVEWLFASPAVRRYWARFAPVLMTDFDFIDFLPYDTSLAVTAVSNPDTVDTFESQITRRWQTVHIDSIVVNTVEELNGVFASRVQSGSRYG